MDGDTPITLAAAKYRDRDGAVQDFHNVWGARHEGELDHTAVAVLTKDSLGHLEVERHDSTAKHLAWGGAILGAALCVVAPPAGVAIVAASAGGLAAIGGIVGHFWNNIPEDDVQRFANLLKAGESGLIVVGVNRRGEDIKPLFVHAEQTFSIDTTWGNLDQVIEQSLGNAEAKKAAVSSVG
jgi:hypothetical protein